MEDWRRAFPDLPPGDEVVLEISLEPCVHCGRGVNEGEIGGFDPVGITDDGLLVGTHVCRSCMEEGK